MADKIINRVANSKLITIDLEDFYPEGKRISLDIKDWLFDGLVLKERDFRIHVKNHDWSQYKNNFIALMCSTDAIIPAWAFMLISIQLEPYANKIILGDLDALESSIYQNIINTLNLDDYKNKSVIIKGCTKKPVPFNAYIMISNKLKPVVKSIMYGEACSSVPLFKSK